LGFNFKEEIIWDKSYSTSPLMALSRIHETVSIFTKGKGKINRVKVPYMEMKSHDLESVIGDVKRMRTILKNTKSLDAVLAFLENNIVPTDKDNTLSTSVSSIIKTQDRCASVMSGIKNGMNEKSIIRTDRIDCETFTKFGVNADKRKTGDRCTNSMQSIIFGLNEKSIIKQVRDQYSAIHPTQKPVRLLERLLALVIPQNKEQKDIVVADFFGGSFSTMEAVHNMGMKGISCEIDKEYYELGKERIEKLPPRQKSLFT
jgi:site-specific DNA-methyltransferase (adenine-specific)